MPSSSGRWLKVVPLLFLLLWSGGFVFLKLGLNYSDPLTFLALRYVLAVGILLLPAIIFRKDFPREPKVLASLAMTGLLIQAGYFSFTYLALKLGMSAGAVALINSQQPILIALLAPALTGEKQTPVRWVGLVLGVTGSAIVILTMLRHWLLFFASWPLRALAPALCGKNVLALPLHPFLPISFNTQLRLP